jgi:hypothetical protein
MQYVPPLGADADAAYVDAQPALGIEGSVVPAAAIEHPQREILDVIEAAELEPDGASLTQLRAAILALAGAEVGAHATRTDNPHEVTAAQLPDLLAHLREHAQATEALLGLLRISTTAEAQGLTDNLTALTPLGLARAFGGGNQLLAAQGYQRLPGGLIVQMTGVNATTSGAAVTWPIAFPGGLLSLAGAGTSELNTYSWAVRALTNGGAVVYSQSGTVGVRLIVLGY